MPPKSLVMATEAWFPVDLTKANIYIESAKQGAEDITLKNQKDGWRRWVGFNTRGCCWWFWQASLC